MKDRRCLDGYFIRLEKRVLHLRYDYHLSYNESEERLGVEWPFTRLMRERDCDGLGCGARTPFVMNRSCLSQLAVREAVVAQECVSTTR